MNNDELIEYAIRTSNAIKEEIKPKLIDYFYKQREVIDKVINLIVKETESMPTNGCKIRLIEILDILKEASE